MSEPLRIGVTYVQGARVDIDYWPLTPEVIETLSQAISTEIDRLRVNTGEHAIVVEVCGSRMQITAEAEGTSDDHDYEHLGELFSARWHGIMLSPDLRQRLEELALPTRYNRSDPV